MICVVFFLGLGSSPELLELLIEPGILGENKWSSVEQEKHNDKTKVEKGYNIASCSLIVRGIHCSADQR